MVSALVTRGYITRDSHLIQSQPWTMDLDGPATPSLGELLAESTRVLQQTVTIRKASGRQRKGRMGKIMAAGGLQSAAASSVKAKGSGGVVKMMAKAGATHVVVMARAHPETIKCVVQAGKDYGVSVMGDNLGCPDMVEGARQLEELGCDMVIHHIGYDERRGIAAAGKPWPNPLDQLREVVDAVSVPVQAVGGLSLEQAIACPSYGAPLVVIGAPLAIDADSFSQGAGDVEEVLRKIC